MFTLQLFPCGLAKETGKTPKQQKATNKDQLNPKEPKKHSHQTLTLTWLLLTPGLNFNQKLKSKDPLLNNSQETATSGCLGFPGCLCLTPRGKKKQEKKTTKQKATRETTFSFQLDSIEPQPRTAEPVVGAKELHHLALVQDLISSSDLLKLVGLTWKRNHLTN